MWVLSLANEERGKVFYLTQRKSEFSVGRSNADLILSNDSSISRKHSVICIGTRDTCPFQIKTRTGIWVKDLSSKYGTFLQDGQSWVKMAPGINTQLPHGSFVRFGVVTNIWSVEYKPLIVCPSNVSEEMTGCLKEKIAPLDGILLTQFDPRCALVVTPSISLSLKVLLALIYGIPIVSPAYIDEVAKAINESLEWPSPSNFLPPLAEIAVRVADANFDHKQSRRDLFKGLTFYVGTNDQLESLKLVIEGAGGRICVFGGRNMERLMAEGAVLLESSQSRATMSQRSQTQDSQWNEDIKGFLATHGRRTVPEREIPLAIVYSSVAKLCNARCQDFNIRLTSSASLTAALNSAVIEPSTEPSSSEQGVGSGFIDASLTQNRMETEKALHSAETAGPSRIASISSKNFKVPSVDIPASAAAITPSLKSGSCASSTVNPLSRVEPSRKRYGSVDIFEEERPYKRIPSNEPYADPKSIPSSKASTSSSKSKDKLSSFWENGGSSDKKSTGPSVQMESQLHKSNPFGAGLVTSTPAPAEKRHFHDSEDISFVRPKKRRQDDVDSPAPVVPVVRPDLIPRVPRKEVTAPKPVVDADEFGFIDMSYKKEKDCEADGIGTTIIMLSLVTLAHKQMHIASPADPVVGGLKNVKVFKKQPVIGLNRSVDVESLQAQVIDEAWAATDP